MIELYLLTIAVEEDEAEGHQHGVPVEVNAKLCGAPGQAALVVLHPVHSQAEEQQTNNLREQRIISVLRQND